MTLNLEQTNDYQSLLRDGIPIIDVRAPAEFEKGAIPTAVNIPVLNDAERAEVGIAYKKNGSNAAVAKGHELVSGDIRKSRLQQCNSFFDDHPNAVLCCWRGGMRSEIAQQWMAESGRHVPRVTGGSKALRTYCLSVLDSARSRKFVILAGLTGCGKTKLIDSVEPTIDLEKLANHRGSAFGQMGSPQPTPIAFEFALAAELLRIPDGKHILIEDEGRMIGRLKVPDPILDCLAQSPIVQVECDSSDRVEFTYESYVVGTSGDTLRSRLYRIRKRLGLERHDEILAALERANASGQLQDHHRWIELLLRWYYDPMYEYQLAKKQDRIEIRGDEKTVRSHLRDHYNIRRNEAQSY